MERIEFPDTFFTGIDLNFIIQNISGSDLMPHADKISQELRSQGSQDLL